MEGGLGGRQEQSYGRRESKGRLKKNLSSAALNCRHHFKPVGEKFLEIFSGLPVVILDFVINVPYKHVINTFMSRIFFKHVYFLKARDIFLLVFLTFLIIHEKAYA